MIKNKQKHLLILLLIVTILFSYNIVKSWPFTVDDAFISFRYARNLGEGYGYRWNIDQAPVEGFTNFSLVSLLGLAHRIGLDIVVTAKLIGIISTASIGVVLWLYSWERFKSVVISSVVIVLFFVPETISLHAVSGLETMVFSLLLVLIMFSIYKLEQKGISVDGNYDEGQNKNWIKNHKYEILVSLFSLLLTLTRPEGAIVFCFVMLYILIFYREKFISQLVVSVVFLVIPGLIYFLIRWSYFGYLLPNTFYVKTAVGNSSFFNLHMIRNGYEYIFEYLKFIGISGIGLILISIFGINKINRFEKILISSFFTFLGLYLFVRVNTMGYGHRFVIPSYPLVLMIIVSPLSSIYLSIKNSLRKNYGKFYYPQLVSVFLMVCFTLLLGYKSLSTTQAAFFNNYAKGLENAHVAIGKLLNMYDLNGRLVVMSDAGAIPYYSNWDVIDGGLLNDPYMTRNGIDLDYIYGFNPDAFVLTSGYAHSLDKKVYQGIISDERFQKYSQIAIFHFNNNYWEHLYLRNDLPYFDQMKAEMKSVSGDWRPYSSSEESEGALRFAVYESTGIVSLFFPEPRAEEGDFVGIKKALQLDPGQCYQISLDIFDPYKRSGFTGRISQYVLINGTIFWEYDIADNSFHGWYPVSVYYQYENDNTEINIESRGIGKLEEGWSWESFLFVRINNFEVEESDECKK